MTCSYLIKVFKQTLIVLLEFESLLNSLNQESLFLVLPSLLIFILLTLPKLKEICLAIKEQCSLMPDYE